MIKKMLNWASARVLAAIAFSLPLAAMAATPVAVWDGGSADYNFTQLTRGGYTLAQIGQGYSTQAAANGSYLQIGESNTEAAFTLKKSDGSNMGASTVIIKFEDMPANGGYNRALLSFLKNGTFNNVSDIPYPFIGVAEEKNLSWASSFIWDNGIWDSASNVRTPNAFSAGQHTAALAYSYAAGSAFYVDGVLRGSSSGLKAQDYNPLGVAIGGVADSRTSNKFYAMTGMKVTAIAFFEDKISDADVASYVFPSDADKLWTATVSANTAWADIAWDGNKTWQADMSEAKVQLTIESGATVTAPASLTVDNLIVSGAGTLTFATGENTVSASGVISAAVTLPANATLKTSGVLRFDSSSNAFAGNSLFEVVSGTAYLNAAQCGLSGDITVDAGATLVNLRSSDALNYNASPVTTVRVYGTLDFGSTRWSTRGVARNCYYFYDGAVIKGVGDGNGALDFIEGSTGGAINLEGAVALSATIRTRDAASNIALTVAEGKTATLNFTSSVIGTGKSFSKAGAGTLKFANNPTFDAGLKVNAGALDFTGVSEVTTKVIYTEKPSTGIGYLQASNWKGRFVADWQGANGTNFPINDYGTANSVVEVTKLSGGYVSLSNADVTVVPTVDVSGTMLLDNGYSGKVTTFTKLTGAGVFSNTTYTVNVTTLDNFTGTLTPLDSTGMTIGTVNLSAVPAEGAKVVSLGEGANIKSIKTTQVSIGGTVDNSIKLVVKSDGIYRAETVATITYPDSTSVTSTDDLATILGTLYTGYTADKAGTVVTVLDGSDAALGNAFPDIYTYDSTAHTYTLKTMVARIGQMNFYSSFASAVANATAGQTVVLLDNVALSSTVVITNSITLDLNGKNIAATDARALWIKSGAVSITGTGAISANGTGLGETSSVIRVGDGAVNANAAGLTIGAGVTVSSEKCYGVTVFGKNTPGISLVVNGTVAVTSSGEADAAISGNGSPGLAATYITINNGATVTSAYSAAIYNPGAGTLTVNGGTISGKHGIVARAGSVTVNGGTITATGTAQDAETIGDAGTAVPCAAIVYDAGANYPGFAEGTALEIKGGTITANVDSIETTGEPSVAVSGGTFSSAVDSEYCAEGYEPTDLGNGQYGVRVDRGWIYEAYDYPGYTGSWANDVTYDGTTHKAAIEDGNTYTATNPSDGRMVTLNMTMSFDGANDDDTDLSLAKAAVRLGEGANSGEYVFELATTGTVDNVATQVWATATGFTPTVETDYNLLFVLDLTNKTYTAAVITYANETATTNALSVAGSTTIAFANQGAATAVQEIEFVGGGSVTALTGSYEDVEEPEVFVANDEVTLNGGSATLTAAQAAWLNACGNKATVASAIVNLTAAQFSDAYLLNLDVTEAFSYTFAVTEIEVGNNSVEVEVTLTRTGALTENEAAKPINGTLTLSGTAALGTAFAEISSTALEFENAGFSGGATTSTVTVDTTKTTAKFYKAVITTPAEN